MKKAVIYARYSSRGQTEQSIEGQLRICRKFAQEHDFVILNEYIDRAKTAQNDLRPAFQKMLVDSGKKQFEYVIVYAVDRFSRDDGDYGADKKILRLNGVKLISATETIGTNADGTENLGGILTEGILVALAKYYSRELSKKVKRGQYESLQKGTHLGGHTLFGYKIENKVILIDQEQAETVKMIYEMYSNGKSAFDIADYLKEKGITNSSGKAFVPNTIMNMLKNKKYIGIFKYGEQIIENYYPPIIDRDTFELVQERISQNKRSPARMKAKEMYLLSGKLYCGYCKSLMTGESGASHTGTVHNYYKCFGRKRGNGCNKKTVSKKTLEDVVVEATLKHILDIDVVNQITTQLLKIQNEQRDTAELTLLRKELSQIKAYIKNLLTAIKKGVITNSTQEELLKLESEQKTIEEKIVKAEYSKSSFLTKDKIEFWFEQFASINPEDEGARQYLITYFINKIILFDDKIVIIYNHEGKNRTEVTFEELEDTLGSDYVSLAERVITNPNLIITKNFIALITKL